MEQEAVGGTVMHDVIDRAETFAEMARRIRLIRIDDEERSVFPSFVNCESSRVLIQRMRERFRETKQPPEKRR